MDVDGYYGYASGSKGERFFMRFMGDQLTLVDENFMRGRKWSGGGNDGAWIKGCKGRGKPVWQYKSKQWKRIIEGRNSGKDVARCVAECVQEPSDYPSWKSGGYSHRVAYQTSEPTGCLKISIRNAVHGLVPEAETACIPDMTDPHELAAFLRRNNKKSRLRLGKHRRYDPARPRNDYFKVGMRYIFFDEVLIK